MRSEGCWEVEGQTGRFFSLKNSVALDKVYPFVVKYKHSMVGDLVRWLTKRSNKGKKRRGGNSNIEVRQKYRTLSADVGASVFCSLRFDRDCKLC